MFIILNKENNPLLLKEVDKDAAQFFGVPYDEKQYARPSTNSISWYDPVDYAIIGSRKGRLDWTEVIAQMLAVCVSYTDSIEEGEKYFRIFRPYIELCYHLKAKGYTPVCI